MSASWPLFKKTFVPIVNGTTFLWHLLWKMVYDEEEAVQTWLGAPGVTLANTDSLKNLLLGYRRGCSVDYKGAADLYVRAGEIAIPDASGNLRFRRNTSDTTVDWTMIDTGAEANSTVYYVYAVADASGTTFTIKISTNATTPTGCTFYKLLGTAYNNASGDFEEVANLNRDTSHGNWVAKANNTVYLAATDGDVICITNDATTDLNAYTDGSNPPTTRRGGFAPDSYSGSITMPVRKGDYWKVTGASTVYWLPKS